MLNLTPQTIKALKAVKVASKAGSALPKPITARDKKLYYSGDDIELFMDGGENFLDGAAYSHKHLREGYIEKADDPLNVPDYSKEITNEKNPTAQISTNALKALLVHVARDNRRPKLCGIHFDRRNAVSTDGHTMIMQEIVSTIDHATIPTATVKLALKLFRGLVKITRVETSRLGVEKYALTSPSSSTTIVTKALDERYADYEKVAPAKASKKITVQIPDVDYLRDLIKRNTLDSNYEKIEIPMGDQFFDAYILVKIVDSGFTHLELGKFGDPATAICDIKRTGLAMGLNIQGNKL